MVSGRITPWDDLVEPGMSGRLKMLSFRVSELPVFENRGGNFR